jgi:hypothetical protein
MHGNRICAGIDSKFSSLDYGWIIGAPGLADRGNVIDVNAK